MKITEKGRPFLLLVAAFVLAMVGPSLLAQGPPPSAPAPNSPAPTSEGFHLDVTPYIWFAGVHGTTGIAGRETTVHAGFSDIADYLNLGFMGTVEPRYKRVLFPMDFMWIKLTDKKSLEFDSGATTVKAEFKQTIFTPGIGYRLVDRQKVIVDWLMAARYWHLNNSFSIQGPVVNNGVSATADWADAVSGGRISVALSPKVSVTVGGDAGGGSARSDYEVYGVLGLRIAKKWVLKAGYRYMDVNYRPSSTFVYDVEQSGIIAGATWNVK